MLKFYSFYILFAQSTLLGQIKIFLGPVTWKFEWKVISASDSLYSDATRQNLSVIYQYYKRYFCPSRKPNESTFILKRLLKGVNYININKIKNSILVDALFKSDARSMWKQETRLYGLQILKRRLSSNPCGQDHRRHLFIPIICLIYIKIIMHPI